MLQYLRSVFMTSLVASVTIAGLAACSSISVTSDWDSDVDFSSFKTFALLPGELPAVNRLIDQRIRNALVVELSARGLRQVEAHDNADLAVGYQVTSEERTTYQTVYSGWRRTDYGFRASRSGWGRTASTSRTQQINFTVGTLVVAMFRMSDKELVWEGTGSATVDPSSGPERSERRINDAVRQILEGFPPGGKPGS